MAHSGILYFGAVYKCQHLHSCLTRLIMLYKSNGSSSCSMLCLLCLLGAEETQRMKTVASSMPSAAAGAKSVVGVDHSKHDTETSVTKSASSLPSKPHQAGAGSSAHVHASFPRPIRPTQVEPSAPDLQSSSLAAKPRPLMQLQLQPQQQAPYRPPIHNAPQARRSALIFSPFS